MRRPWEREGKMAEKKYSWWAERDYCHTMHQSGCQNLLCKKRIWLVPWDFQLQNNISKHNRKTNRDRFQEGFFYRYTLVCRANKHVMMQKVASNYRPDSLQWYWCFIPRYLYITFLIALSKSFFLCCCFFLFNPLLAKFSYIKPLFTRFLQRAKTSRNTILFSTFSGGQNQQLFFSFRFQCQRRKCILSFSHLMWLDLPQGSFHRWLNYLIINCYNDVLQMRIKKKALWERESILEENTRFMPPYAFFATILCMVFVSLKNHIAPTFFNRI